MSRMGSRLTWALPAVVLSSVLGPIPANNPAASCPRRTGRLDWRHEEVSRLWSREPERLRLLPELWPRLRRYRGFRERRQGPESTPAGIPELAARPPSDGCLGKEQPRPLHPPASLAAVSSARERHARTTDGYDRGAAAYARRGEASGRAWFEEPQRRFRALLETGDRVLDVGCASGLEMADLRALDLAPVGLDLSTQQLRIARHRLPSAGLARATARALPFQTGTFQGVWASASLPHLARAEAPGALAEIRRVLADGGAFYASVQRGCGGPWGRTSGTRSTKRTSGATSWPRPASRSCGSLPRTKVRRRKARQVGSTASLLRREGWRGG